MKTSIIHAFFAIILVAAIGCKKDLTQSLNESAELQSQMLPADVQAEIDQAIVEIENDYNNPPSDGVVGNRAVVHVPAGSVDALQDAIDEAGWGGKVIVESGEHWESETVVIDHTVRIIGQDGAKVYFNTIAASAKNEQGYVLTEAGFHVKNANHVWIKGLEIYPQQSTGSMAIWLEGGRMARIEGNKISAFKYAIWLSDNSNAVGIYDNEIDGASNVTIWGITVESGKSVKIKENHLDQCVVGIFLSDERSITKDNHVSNSVMGYLLCTVQGTIVKPDGELLQPAISCAKAKLIRNNAQNNYWNYLVIDGAHHNFLVRNNASNPGLYDVELAGPTSRFGFPAPTSYSNFVVNPNSSIITKDCGVDNTVLGGTMVNNEEDPCF